MEVINSLMLGNPEIPTKDSKTAPINELTMHHLEPGTEYFLIWSFELLYCPEPK